jgi:hypothetical protein
LAAHITDTEIRNLKPREKLYRVSLSEEFCIIVNPDGSKYWRLRYSYGALEKMLALGVYTSCELLNHEELEREVFMRQ